MKGLVSLQSVGKTFQTGEGSVRALATTSLTIDKGRFLAIVGPSGCGKSTLLRLIAGLLTPTEGEVSVDGKPVNGPRNDLGIMFQDPVLLPWRTVLANVMLPAEIMKLNREAARERAQKLLEMVGLDGFESRYPGQLSGGEQQRVAMVRTLLPNPQVLLLDEPFGALDAMTREQLNLDLQRIWLDSGKTVVLITHSIQEAVFLGDDVAVMSPRPGRITEVLPVPLPRPRTFEIVGDAAFGRVAGRVRHALEGLSRGTLEGGTSPPVALSRGPRVAVPPELEGGRVPRWKP